MITILGDGAWGTAWATLLAENNHDVMLWCFNKETAQEINTCHKNTRYLPAAKLSTKITATTSLHKALKNTIIFQAIPVQFIRKTLQPYSSLTTDKKIWISLSKGIEEHTLNRPSEIINSLFPKSEILIISGPSYASDLAQKNPTIVSLAGAHSATRQKIRKLLANAYFCIEETDDIKGTELCGAFKNIFALGSGILAGLGFGTNSQVCMMLHGINEIKELLRASHTNENTLYSPAGIGDITLTCFGSQSRNYKVGYARGQGKKLNDYLQTTGIVPEGLNTLKSIQQLKKKYNLSLPLCSCLFDIFIKKCPPQTLADMLCKN